MTVFSLESTWLGRRGGGPDLPAWSRWAPLLLLRWGAQLRRDKGRYDSFTLALFRRIRARDRRPQALLAYLMFRRDLGWPLMKWHVPLLMQALAQLSQAQRRCALNLLTEAGYPTAEEFPLPGATGAEEGSGGGRTESETDGKTDGKTGSAIGVGIRAMQTVWRADFAQWLRQRSADGICVVGNGGRLLGAGLGEEIDRHAVVVRFNQFRDAANHLADLGSRVDVWVTSPGFSGAVPAGVEWVVVSGPDMAFRLQDWRRFETPRRLGAKVLTIPLPPWADLVQRLDAPPSAGLLFLAWARSLLGSWPPIRALGFGDAIDGSPVPHVVARHQPSGRHHWPAERLLFSAWQAQGLRAEYSPGGGD